MREWFEVLVLLAYAGMLQQICYLLAGCLVLSAIITLGWRFLR